MSSPSTYRIFTNLLIRFRGCCLTVLVGISFAFTPLVSADDHSPPITLARFGTSSVGSTFYVMANGLANLMRNHAGINMTIEPIGGSYANIFTLKAGKIDYAITNAGAAFDGRYGKKPFQEPYGVSLIAQGQTSLRFIVVRRSAKIEHLSDLEGKILIGRRPALPEMAEISNAMINAAGLTDINIVSTKDTKESLRHLRSGTVTGIMIPGGERLAAVVELFRDGYVDPVYFDKDIIASMQKQLPAYLFTKTLPAGHFEGQEKDLTVFGLNTYLVAGSHVSEEQVYLMTKTLFENQEEFQAFHSEARMWTLQNTLADPKVPFHSGAIQYFKEKGVWTNELEQKQAALLSSVIPDY